jgi:hypothetical protein
LGCVNKQATQAEARANYYKKNKSRTSKAREAKDKNKKVKIKN